MGRARQIPAGSIIRQVSVLDRTPVTRSMPIDLKTGRRPDFVKYSACSSLLQASSSPGGNLTVRRLISPLLVGQSGSAFRQAGDRIGPGHRRTGITRQGAHDFLAARTMQIHNAGMISRAPSNHTTMRRPSESQAGPKAADVNVDFRARFRRHQRELPAAGRENQA